jgi:hypothetical protein
MITHVERSKGFASGIVKARLFGQMRLERCFAC